MDMKCFLKLNLNEAIKKPSESSFEQQNALVGLECYYKEKGDVVAAQCCFKFRKFLCKEIDKSDVVNFFTYNDFKDTVEKAVEYFKKEVKNEKYYDGQVVNYCVLAFLNPPWYQSVARDYNSQSIDSLMGAEKDI